MVHAADAAAADDAAACAPLLPLPAADAAAAFDYLRFRCR